MSLPVEAVYGADGDKAVAEVGCIEEGPGWAVAFGEECRVYEYPWLGPPDPPCPHARDHRTDTTENKIDGTLFRYHVWRIPRTVVAKNEGGHASTSVCLDCILAFGG